MNGYWAALSTVIGIGLLWCVGRVSIVKAVNALRSDAATILDYHNELTDLANSGFDSTSKVDKLIVDAARVQVALGRDNIVRGVQVGMFLLNGATLLPRALYELRDIIRSNWRTTDAYALSDTVRGVLLNSFGRKKMYAEHMAEKADNPILVIAKGWSAIIEVPLTFARGIGLISPVQRSRAAGSLLFRLVSFATFLAALAGPILAYLADRQAIDGEVQRLSNARSTAERPGTTSAVPAQVKKEPPVPNREPGEMGQR